LLFEVSGRERPDAGLAHHDVAALGFEPAVDRVSGA
jgi:hypothetical protein